MLLIVPAFSIAPVFVPSLGFVLIPIVPSFSIPTFPIIVPPFSTSIVFIVPAFCIPYSFSPLPIAPIVPALSSELSTAPDSVDISYIAPVLYIAFVVPSIVSPFSMLRISVIVPAFSIPYSLLVALLLPVPSIAFCAPNDRLPPDSLLLLLSLLLFLLNSNSLRHLFVLCLLRCLFRSYRFLLLSLHSFFVCDCSYLSSSFVFKCSYCSCVVYVA